MGGGNTRMSTASAAVCSGGGKLQGLERLNIPLYMLDEHLPLRLTKPLKMKKPPLRLRSAKAAKMARVATTKVDESVPASMPRLVYLGEEDISPLALTERIVYAMAATIPAALAAGEFRQVISLGVQAERDFTLLQPWLDTPKLKELDVSADMWIMESDLYGVIGQAFARNEDWAEAAQRFEWQTECYAAARRKGLLETFVRTTEALMNLGTVQLKLGALVKAKKTFEKVRQVGVSEGCFAAESKACEGLSRWASHTGQHADAKEYGLQVRPKP